MPNQTSAHAPQSTIDPMYRNLAKGATPHDKSEIIYNNALYIDTLCDLIEGYDDTISNEPVIHAIGLMQRLSREIMVNGAGIYDYLPQVTGGNHE